MILQNFWYVGATAKELKEAPLARTVCELPIVFFRGSNGKAAAIRDFCSHRRAPLSLGKVLGDAIECPYHGMRFDSAGRCVLIPSQSMIPVRANIPAYSVAERYGLIWVWIGEEPADEGKLPDLPWRESKEWDCEIIYHYHVAANHMLMTDNLLDLGHVAFIHSDTVGFDPAVLRDDPLKTEILGDTVRNTRIVSDVEPSPNARNVAAFRGKVERTSISTWYPPHYTSILFATRDSEFSLDFHIDHFITPETPRSHNYWVAVARNFGLGDPGITQRVYLDTDRVHQQDLRIVEAQQRMIEQSHAISDMPIRQDRGLVAAHRIMERIYKQQQTRHAAEQTASPEHAGQTTEEIIDAS